MLVCLINFVKLIGVIVMVVFCGNVFEKVDLVVILILFDYVFEVFCGRIYIVCFI